MRKIFEHAKQRQEYVKQVDMKNVVTAEAELTIAKIKMSKEKLESNGESSADLLAERNIADCVRVKAQAESEVVKKIGEANASAAPCGGKRARAVMKLEAAAWRKFGDAALVQVTLPALAEEMGKPLASTTEGIFISNGEPSKSEDLEEYDVDYGSGTLLIDNNSYTNRRWIVPRALFARRSQRAIEKKNKKAERAIKPYLLDDP